MYTTPIQGESDRHRMRLTSWKNNDAGAKQLPRLFASWQVASQASNRIDFSQAFLRQRHPGGDVARLANIEVEREHGPGGALLRPSDQPAQRRLADLGAQQTGLGPDQ